MVKLTGVFPVVLTPFKWDDQSIDYKTLDRHVDFLLDSGAHGLCVNGSTSEFALLSDKEAYDVVEKIFARVDGKVPIIVGASAISTWETIEFVRMGEDLGANALLILPPYYYPLNDEEIYKHFELVSQSTKLPIMVYNNPHTTKLDIKPELIARLSKIGNIAYVKESTGLASRVHDIKDMAGDDIDVFIGSDNIFFDALVSGATGVIASSGNVITSFMVEIYNLIINEKNIDLAREKFQNISPLVSFIDGSPNFVQVLKTALEIMGRPVGPPRYPLLNLSGNSKEKLKNILERLELA